MIRINSASTYKLRQFCLTQALFTGVRYRTVPPRSVPKSGTERGCVHTGNEKSSGPFQNRSRNWSVRKSEPEIGTIRYRTVPLSCEQTCLVSMGDTKLVSMTTFDVEAEIKPNCTSLILPIVSSFQNRPLTSTVYSY